MPVINAWLGPDALAQNAVCQRMYPMRIAMKAPLKEEISHLSQGPVCRTVQGCCCSRPRETS